MIITFPSHPTQSLLDLAPEFDPTTKRVVIVTTSTYCIPTPPKAVTSLPTHEQPTVLLPNNPTTSSKEPTSAHVTTGYSLPDVIHPFNLLRSMGVQVEIASIEGGKILNDPTTDHFVDEDDVMRSVFHNPVFREMIENTQPLESYLNSDKTFTATEDPHRQKRIEGFTSKQEGPDLLDAEQEMKQAIEHGKVHDVQEMFAGNRSPPEDQREADHPGYYHLNQGKKGKPIDALLFAGGFGCMWDFPFHPVIDELARHVYEDRKGIVACIGHGSAALLNIRLSNGDLLVAGKECTSTTNEEEYNNHRLSLYPKHQARGQDLHQKNSTPLLLNRLEDLLRNAGGIYKNGDMLTSFTVVDPPILADPKLISESEGRLITGQNCYSAKEVAEQLLIALSYQP